MFCFSRFSRSPVIWTNSLVKFNFFQNRFCSEKSFQSSVNVVKAVKGEHKNCEEEKLSNLILENTLVHRSSMVPEIGLHLITPKTKLWNDPYDEGKTFGSDPFWYFHYFKFILDLKSRSFKVH